VDFIQVALDGLQVGNAIATTQLQNQLQQGKKERDDTAGERAILLRDGRTYG